MRLRTMAAAAAVTVTLGTAALTSLPSATAVEAPAPGGYHRISPNRVLDTRDGTGGVSGRVGADYSISFPARSTAGVPATGVSAVVFNLTVVDPTSPSYVTAYPNGTQKPYVSSINVEPGKTRANLVTVPVGADGRVALYNNQGNVDLVADIVGYYDTDGTAGGFIPVTPYRLVDSRDGDPFDPYSAYDFYADFGAEANPHVTALALNITAIYPQSPGYLVAWDGNAEAPLASNLNFLPGDIVPNSAVVPVRQDDRYNTGSLKPTFTLGNGSPGAVDVAVDVVGFYQDGFYDDYRYEAITPTRVLDTRIAQGGLTRFGPAETKSASVPPLLGTTGTELYAGNLTIVDPTRPDYLTLWQQGKNRPNVSNLNAGPGQTVANSAYAPKDYQVYNNDGGADVLLDVSGRLQLHVTNTPTTVTPTAKASTVTAPKPARAALR